MYKRAGLIGVKDTCPPPLKCIDDVCRPQSCYSKNECPPDEDCLKWPSIHSVGICYKPGCETHLDCPTGMMCQDGVCLRTFCKKDSECGSRFKCVEGSCVLKVCMFDFECGYRVRFDYKFSIFL